MKAEPPDIKYELPKKKIVKEPAKKQDKIKTDAEGMDRHTRKDTCTARATRCILQGVTAEETGWMM